MDIKTIDIATSLLIRCSSLSATRRIHDTVYPKSSHSCVIGNRSSIFLPFVRCIFLHRDESPEHSADSVVADSLRPLKQQHVRSNFRRRKLHVPQVPKHFGEIRSLRRLRPAFSFSHSCACLSIYPVPIYNR